MEARLDSWANVMIFWRRATRQDLKEGIELRIIDSLESEARKMETIWP